MFLAVKAVRKHRAANKEEAAKQQSSAQNVPIDAAPALVSNGPHPVAQPIPNAATDSVTTKPFKACKHHPKAPVSNGNMTAEPHGPFVEQSSETKSGFIQTQQFDSKGNCLLCKNDKHNARTYRWRVICGLLLPFLLASLDMTVVATALGFIASYFGKYDQLNWIVTSYTLTSTAFIPVFGQLADIFGRHSMLQVSMVLMAVGSTFAAAAQTWGMLLFGRALQGISAAGIQVLVWVVLADKVTLREQSKNNSIFSFMSGISYAIGPVVGGYLTNANWRYCFVISIPIAVAANILIFILLRKDLVAGDFAQGHRSIKTFFQSLRTIDFVGSILFLFGVGLIILATAWGGASYPWTSTHVLPPLVIGCVLFVIFFPYELLLEQGHFISRLFSHQIPMIPFSLFQKRDVFILCIVQFATGAALYSIFYFIGIYYTLVEGYSASSAGVQLLYYIPGIGVGVYSAMFLCNVWPCQTFWPIFLGTVIETAGFALITWAVTTRNVPLIDGMMGIAGLGTGLRFMPVSLHVCGIWPQKIPSVMSIMRFMLPFGGTLSLTIMGSVFNNKMSYGTTGLGGNGGFGIHNQQSLTLLKNLPAAERAVIEESAKNAVKWAFISVLPILAISVIAAFFLGNVWIKTIKAINAETGEKNVEGADEDSGTESKALHGIYLSALLRGRVAQQQVESKR